MVFIAVHYSWTLLCKLKFQGFIFSRLLYVSAKIITCDFVEIKLMYFIILNANNCEFKTWRNYQQAWK